MRPTAGLALLLFSSCLLAQDRYLVDWDAIGEESINHLVSLVRIDTTNPPGTSQNSDTGRSQFDNITYDATPQLFFRLDDALLLHDLPGNPQDDAPPDEVIQIPFQAGPAQPTQAGFAIAIFDEGPTPSQSAEAPLLLLSGPQGLALVGTRRPRQGAAELPILRRSCFAVVTVGRLSR